MSFGDLDNAIQCLNWPTGTEAESLGCYNVERFRNKRSKADGLARSKRTTSWR